MLVVFYSRENPPFMTPSSASAPVGLGDWSGPRRGPSWVAIPPPAGSGRARGGGGFPAALRTARQGRPFAFFWPRTRPNVRVVSVPRSKRRTRCIAREGRRARPPGRAGRAAKNWAPHGAQFRQAGRRGMDATFGSFDPMVPSPPVPPRAARRGGSAGGTRMRCSTPKSSSSATPRLSAREVGASSPRRIRLGLGKPQGIETQRGREQFRQGVTWSRWWASPARSGRLPFQPIELCPTSVPKLPDPRDRNSHPPRYLAVKQAREFPGERRPLAGRQLIDSGMAQRQPGFFHFGRTRPPNRSRASMVQPAPKRAGASDLGQDRRHPLLCDAILFRNLL